MNCFTLFHNSYTLQCAHFPHKHIPFHIMQCRDPNQGFSSLPCILHMLVDFYARWGWEHWWGSSSKMVGHTSMSECHCIISYCIVSYYQPSLHAPPLPSHTSPPLHTPPLPSHTSPPFTHFLPSHTSSPHTPPSLHTSPLPSHTGLPIRHTLSTLHVSHVCLI